MAYARNTEVPFERSIAEIVGLIRDAGADRIGQLEERDRFTLHFQLEGRVIQFRVTFPSSAEIEQLKGPRQDGRRVEEQWRRQRARALLLVIKAKLESVESGVETFEQAFLSNVLLADGLTVYERIATPIVDEYRTGYLAVLRLGGPS
ncbi:hypothetical protein ACQVP2_35740 [Methylobacterium aquaticum]|uniref:hypothetical protein n=1 Tax=Methylobacterium aquaticum TaxID=270351 RepID=UPI003D169853